MNVNPTFNKRYGARPTSLQFAAQYFDRGIYFRQKLNRSGVRRDLTQYVNDGEEMAF